MARAVVTGLGAVSGFGAGAEPLWRALVEGRGAVRPSAALDRAGVAGVLAEAPADGPWGAILDGGDRATAMALAAAGEAVRDAGLAPPTGGADERLAVSVGTTLGGIGRWLDAERGSGRWEDVGRWTWAAPAEAIARAHGAAGAVVTSTVACASGNAALGVALGLVRSGRADAVIAGGVDALHDFVIAGFASLKAMDPAPCRPFDRARRGLNLGEGAAFLVVESEARARARGATVRAFLDGYGDAADAHHMTGPDKEGRGAARAMRAALDDARLAPADVDFVSAHGTATPFNDLMEARALEGVLGARAPSVPVSSIKAALGHTLGAAGALEALLCVRVLETGLVPPTLGLVERDPEIPLDVVAGAARPVSPRVALSTSSGFGGTNAALVLCRSTP